MDFGASPFGNSPHRDVLEAPIPVDGVSRLVLLQELKNRGKAAVQGTQYPDAIALYQKALEVTTDGKEQSILESNLSLCHQKMGYYEAAVETGQRATVHDPTYVKGWWRLGQAFGGLHRYDRAVEAMQEAVKREPSNKAIRKELEKFQALKATQPLETLPSSSAPPVVSSSNTAPSKGPATSTAATSKPSATAAASPPPLPTPVVKVDGEEFSASDIVRGYKVVNGKKTSYFHNELSQDAAKLIGDIAPKKLDPATMTQQPSGGTDAESTLVSAWNKAGTWEERDVTTWAVDALKSAITATRHTWDGYSATVQSCEVKGHASVAMVRGKKRYIYEFDLQVNWQVHSVDSTVLLASGKLHFPEIDGTCSGVYEADASVSTCTLPLDRSDLALHVNKHGLREELHGAINSWIERLKETY